MKLLATSWLLSTLLVGVVQAVPHAQRDTVSKVVKRGIEYTVYHHAATGANLEIVKNSGICETTPGVNQYSGYLSVGEDMNMFFWFFEARRNPKTAPLTAWFNGGPGCSSMIGLFQEHGPCRFVNNETTPSLNPYSWNTYSNMIYIDQPIGVGFSYGNDAVNSTVTAAPFVWKLLQAFFAHFPEYESREFNLFTESYGGHYGPEFAHYIQQQNAGIKTGAVTGETINIGSLGINNGWFDSTIQEKAYITYALQNPYRPLINASAGAKYYKDYQEYCVPAIQACTTLGTNAACIKAGDICGDLIDDPIMESGDWDVYDVREPSDDPYPPETYYYYLNNAAVQRAIGARQNYSECPDAPYYKFAATGDGTRSFLATLSDVVQTGINVLLWAGDADWICNWIGGFGVANAVEFAGQMAFQNKTLQPYKVNGTEKGTFKTVGNFTFLRVYEAGHEVPYYQPETALQVFSQIIKKVPPFST
ncbi:putative carboxypeptidase S1 [Aspergillus fijiensis CBS 313.89]|uniref:Carboxypeptidase n=1 Tax=Aspergillus fijiensis CBS 313.89 TaxID=1448319 RepID=A0A8G1RVA8_9EURO|nr:putative carboxypeptidase S1 [Aspergillus fijiensis CBS 313.89]RAK79377.1 putative carboxypeptidase S1 [Aspergillus fijiensis CBS 313.89]